MEGEMENDYSIMVSVDIVTPSSSSRHRIIVADISPLPRPAIWGPRKRKTQRATVLTASPYKSQLEERRRLKDEEVNKKRQRTDKLAVVWKKTTNRPKCAKQVDNSNGLSTDKDTVTMPKKNSRAGPNEKNATAKLANKSDACEGSSQSTLNPRLKSGSVVRSAWSGHTSVVFRLMIELLFVTVVFDV
jgi:hypothetical protein